MGYRGEESRVAVQDVAPIAPAAPAAPAAPVVNAPDFYSAFMEKYVKPVLEKGDALGDRFKSLVIVIFHSIICRMRLSTLFS